ncbi:MAG: amidohydrolase family protein [Phycisphaeraceae bacterium]|nr:amidohydrolase family protein [Phycisphaeraceae bacterium]
MMIDSHQHVFWHGRDDAGLIADMDAHGIDVSWLLSWEILPHEDSPGYHGVLNPLHFRDDGTHKGIPLSDLLLARDRYPGRFIVGYCPHPARASAPKAFEAAYRIHGVRVCGEWKFMMPFDDPRCIELFRKAGELHCPVVLHLDWPWCPDAQGNRVYQPIWYGGTVENLARALESCPQTNFIGHAPGFWRDISGDADTDPAMYPRGPIKPGGKVIAMLEKYPNLFADLSAGSGRYALERDPDHAKKFLTRFQDKLVFGRDYYEQDLHKFLLTLNLDETVKRKIYSENAQKLVKL